MPREVAHVAFAIVDRQAGLCRIGTGAFQKQRNGVDAGDHRAAFGQPVGDPSGAASEIENRLSRAQLQYLPDEFELVRRPLRVHDLGRKIQVVLVVPSEIGLQVHLEIQGVCELRQKRAGADRDDGRLPACYLPLSLSHFCRSAISFS